MSLRHDRGHSTFSRDQNAPFFPLPRRSSLNYLVLLPPLRRAGLGRGLHSRQIAILKCPVNLVQRTPLVFIELVIAKPNDPQSAWRGIAATHAIEAGDRSDRKRRRESLTVEK